jgi:osomolarity two-component system, sensor histidine kinase SLN1
MDSGRFESVSKPYSFHQVMRGLFVPLRLATDARQLELVTVLDPCIDKVRHFLMPDWICGFHFSLVP